MVKPILNLSVRGRVFLGKNYHAAKYVIKLGQFFLAARTMRVSARGNSLEQACLRLTGKEVLQIRIDEVLPGPLLVAGGVARVNVVVVAGGGFRQSGAMDRDPRHF